MNELKRFWNVSMSSIMLVFIITLFIMANRTDLDFVVRIVCGVGAGVLIGIRQGVIDERNRQMIREELAKWTLDVYYKSGMK